GRREREQAHAEDGNRPEQPRDRVREAEVVADGGQQRADAHHLRAQRERGEEEPREEPHPAVRAHYGSNVSYSARSTASRRGKISPTAYVLKCSDSACA